MRRQGTMLTAAIAVLFAAASTTAQPRGGAGHAARSGHGPSAGDAGAPAAAAARPSPKAPAASSSSTTAVTVSGGNAPAAPALSAGTSSTLPSVPTPAPPPTASNSSLDGNAYAVRLRDLEARVDDLKEQIRRSHTRLSLLSDTVMAGGSLGSRGQIVFRNEMSGAFRLTKAQLKLDGMVKFNKEDASGGLAGQKEIPLFAGSIQPGDHGVELRLNFEGGGFGVLTYMSGYKFEVTSRHIFTATEGRVSSITAVAFEKGGVLTPLEQRPAVEWRERSHAIAPAAPGEAPAAPGAAAPEKK